MANESPLPPGKPGWTAIALIASFVLAAVGLFALGARFVTRSPGPDVSAIAVIPFSHVNRAPGDPDAGSPFAHRLADLLARAPGVHIVEAPHAATFVQGEVQTSATRMGVAVWLVRASDRRALWSGKYEFALENAPDVQSRIVHAILVALHLAPAASSTN